MESQLPQYLKDADKFRLNLPEESQFPWLTFLLDAYALIDASVQNALTEKNQPLACKKSCAYCCFQPIPVSPGEAIGIRLLITKLLPQAEREPLLAQLKTQKGNTQWNKGQCPFLINNSCTIYPLRPIACRRYLVVNTPCAYISEDIDSKRPNDLIKPDRAAFYAALAHTSPIYASLGISEQGKVLTFDNFKELFVDLRTVNWS